MTGTALVLIAIAVAGLFRAPLATLLLVGLLLVCPLIFLGVDAGGRDGGEPGADRFERRRRREARDDPEVVRPVRRSKGAWPAGLPRRPGSPGRRPGG